MKAKMDLNIDLNLGQRAMIVAMEAAHPDMGKKKLTTEVRSAGEVSNTETNPVLQYRIYNANMLVLGIGQQAPAGQDEGREVRAA